MDSKLDTAETTTGNPTQVELFSLPGDNEVEQVNQALPVGKTQSSTPPIPLASTVDGETSPKDVAVLLHLLPL